MNELKKTECKNFHQYLWDLDELVQSGKYKNWKEITPIVNRELFGEDESQYRDESAYRKAVKYARDFYEAGVFNNLSEDKYLKELQLQKDAVYKEKRKLYDQRREYNKLLISEITFSTILIPYGS